MADSGPKRGVGYWLLKHGTFTVLVSIGLLFLAAFGLIKATGFRQYHAPADSGAGVVVSSGPAAVGSTQAAAPPASAAPQHPSPALSVVVSDVPGFDLTGSGDACRMHYFQDDQGRTVTLFDLAVDGELITHVSGPDGIGRHDEQMTRGISRIVYDFPLSQATDMGAVLYLSDGTQQSCTISAGGSAA